MDVELPRSVVVDGARIRYGISGSGDRDLLLVHGNGAHHMWWSAMAPLLEPNWRIIAVDLSGHGDSDHRDEYRAELWVRELLGVLDDAGIERTLYAGHSMGGRLGCAFAALHPDRVHGLIMLDSSVRPPERYRDLPYNDAPRPVYPTREAIEARFRLLPPQPSPPASVMAPVIDYSIRETPDGFVWKHDPRAVNTMKDPYVTERAREVQCGVGYVYAGDSSVVDDEIAAYVTTVFQRPPSPVRVEGAHHHIILERPERCAELVDELAPALVAS